ncbi:MAG: hypothetical protein ABI268_04505 [Rhodanobacter sp.]
MQPATRHVLALFALALSGVLHAQSPPPDAPFACDGDDVSTPQTIAIAEIHGQGHVYFLRDTNGCPDAGAGCTDKAYVIPGNKVLTGRTRGAYVCAFYPNRQGGRTGWLPRDRLKPTTSNVSLDSWTGHWVDNDNTIDISRHGKLLHADGNAYYPMADPPLDQFPGGPNLGAMGGDASPHDGRIVFTHEECSVTAILVEPYLVINDNHQCGGLNVRFDGLYQRP